MIRINLLKPGKKEVSEAPGVPEPELKGKKRQFPYMLIFLLVIILIGALFLLQKRELNSEKALLQDAKAEKQSLQYVLTKLEDLERQKQVLSRKINLITRLKSRQGVGVIIMDELSKNLPDWVWLTELDFKDYNLLIKGKSLSNNLIADFISNLEENQYFKNVDLISSTLRETKNNKYLEFSMNASFVLPYTPIQTEESVKENSQ
ncbi:MAG: PilN domain-containing protein [Candidatus Aminicenantes bacterium]|nr:PilN domain-containing protein [Candidatus Aminicenantes bacterium]